MSTVTAEGKSNKSCNHLINESSPYLLQHAYNPVAWYPWTDEALEKARQEDKPIFLSIGYAACHWCHVMEEESFENPEIAALLNEHFVSIKVDREQRPDLDQIYMAATTAISGSGGWPMSVFLTSDLKPFFAGTYFPPGERYGRPGFKQLVTKIAEAYETERGNIEEFAQRVTNTLNRTYDLTGGAETLDRSLINRAANLLMANYDSINGGFGGSPKFPHPTDLSFLMKIYAAGNNGDILTAVEHTLQAMARGGIYDQIGGGFHRYATDSTWLVPHFEKMLYDNAMLAVTYGEAYQITGNESYKKVVGETLDFLIREMRDTEGGFYSSLDADSEGEEGKYYVWQKHEIDNLLDKNSELFCTYYNITVDGNFENQTNIPNLTQESDILRKNSNLETEEFDILIANHKKRLFAERQKRIRPFTDDKILSSWNGLALSGLCRGYQITGDEKYRTAALRAAEFIRDRMIIDGRLLHSYRMGKTSAGLFLEDYAYFVQGVIDLYEIIYDYRWIQLAARLGESAVKLFSDENGILYLSPENQQEHFIRPRDDSDGAMPAPGSVLIRSLLKLADITGDKSMRDKAEKALLALSGNMKKSPMGMISAVAALNYLITDKYELILVGKERREDFMVEINRSYFPNSIIIVSDNGDENSALLEGRRFDGKTMAYICKNSVCQLPATSVDEMRRQLAVISGGNER